MAIAPISPYNQNIRTFTCCHGEKTATHALRPFDTVSESRTVRDRCAQTKPALSLSKGICLHSAHTPHPRKGVGTMWRTAQVLSRRFFGSEESLRPERSRTFLFVCGVVEGQVQAKVLIWKFFE